MNFDLKENERDIIWKELKNQLEDYYVNTSELPVGVSPTRKEVKESVVKDFSTERETQLAIKVVIEGLKKYAVHTPHPRYFGMFNPRTSFPSAIADSISAIFNPQLAAWGHAPFAVEVEHMLLREIGAKFGYQKDTMDGVFTTGGQEANLTAVLAALNHKFPEFGSKGVRGIQGEATLYVSRASHHATIKAAKVSGLGMESVRYVKVNENQEMDVGHLDCLIKTDIKAGKIPFLVVATLGTTGAGAMDPVIEMNKIAKENNMWLHADAAYGGGLVLAEKYKFLLNGIELADSITFDAHKWLSVPMGTSMFLTQHKNVLGKTFSIIADFMPHEEEELDSLGSYTHSIQWSRRFIGLKLYMPLLVFGWKGFSATISRQIEMGKLLKSKLKKNGWHLYNDTELPIACFGDQEFIDDASFSKYIYDSFLQTGDAWIVNYPIKEKYTLRACITNYSTTEKDLDIFIQALDIKRNAFRIKAKRRNSNAVLV